MAKMSYAERRVADFLTEKNIYWEFEKSVFVKDEEERPRTWSPDFYLTNLSIYVEVCGADRPNDYEYRKRIYKKNNIPIIFVETFKDEGSWKHYLLSRITEIPRICQIRAFVVQYRSSLDARR